MTTSKIKSRKVYGRIYSIGALLIAFTFLLSAVVVAQTAPESAVSAQSYIRSRFVLWDTTEKMLDKNFDVVLISWNNTTSSYNIKIDNRYYNGTFYHYKYIPVLYNLSRINILEVQIDNITVLSAANIRVTTGITQTGIEQTEAFKISFLPFELTRFEWNLVYSGIVGVFITLPTAYYTIKFYRRYRGAKGV